MNTTDTPMGLCDELPEAALLEGPMAFSMNRLFASHWEGTFSFEPWPGLRAWFRPLGSNQWHATEPELNLQTGFVGLPGRGSPNIGSHITSPQDVLDGDFADMLRKAFQYLPPKDFWHSDVVRPYLWHVPEDIRELVFSFAHRHWHLLKLLQQCPDAVDLAHSNPGLALALASAIEFVSIPDNASIERLHEVVQQPRREIAGLLGFPATESVVRILRKCQPSLITPAALRYLRQLLDQPAAAKWLRHLPQITTTIIDLFAIDHHFPTLRHLTPGFLEELTELEQGFALHSYPREQMVHLIAQHCVLLEDAGRRGALIESVGQLLGEAAGWRAKHRELPFPKPPLPGTRNIKPLTSCHMLRKEGQAMKNCVARYHGRVSKGGYYIYRMLRPVRGTVAITYGDHQQRWHLDSAEAPGNKSLPPNAMRAIRRWLRHVQPRLEPRCPRVPKAPVIPLMLQLEFEFLQTAPAVQPRTI